MKTIKLVLIALIVILTGCGKNSDIIDDEYEEYPDEHYNRVSIGGYKYINRIYTISPVVLDCLENNPYFRLPIYLNTDIGEVRLTAFNMDKVGEPESTNGELALVMPDKRVFTGGSTAYKYQGNVNVVDSLMSSIVTDTIRGITIIDEYDSRYTTRYDTIVYDMYYLRYLKYSNNKVYNNYTYANLSFTDYYTELFLDEPVLISKTLE